MNIYAKPGTIIWGIFDSSGQIKNGYDSDKAHAAKYIKPHVCYTVEQTVVHSWSSEVYLKEFPGISFNTVHFEQRDSGTMKFEKPEVKEAQPKDTDELRSVTLVKLYKENQELKTELDLFKRTAEPYVTLAKENQELKAEIEMLKLNASPSEIGQWERANKTEALNKELLEALEKLLTAAEYSRYVQKSASLEPSMTTAKILINKAK